MSGTLHEISIEVNGKLRKAQVPARLSLVDWLREDLCLTGTKLEDQAIEEAAADAAKETEPGSDLHATKEYRRHLGRVLAARALREARDRARAQ